MSDYPFFDPNHGRTGAGARKKALIAMSGGVDSSLAAKLMRDRGFYCIGCTMKLYNNEDAGLERSRTCCSLDDVEDARNVAFKLGMPFYVFNFTDAFRDTVIRKFIESYEQGITPNPCIDCNRYMKFDKLYERAKILGCDYVVTGHYARIEEQDGKFVLKKALDETKDQSYVLYSMTQRQLAHTVFPLGNMRKTQVRQRAGECGFVNAKKPDSQDICFVPDGDYARFIQEYTGIVPERGDVIDSKGNVLGRHEGIINYTIGQRKGLGIAFGKPMYVIDKNLEDNTVTEGESEELFSDRLRAVQVNVITDLELGKAVKCKAKTRYKQVEQACEAVFYEDGTAEVLFEEPQRAVTKGQRVVFYDGDVVLGGGVIV